MHEDVKMTICKTHILNQLHFVESQVVDNEHETRKNVKNKLCSNDNYVYQSEK
jgi:hypothetical protein